MAHPKQEFLVKDLPTKSVTLYPARARIVRDIHDVSLQPGQNEIEIYGLSPTVDEQSVQIDGKGDAIITDIAVELVPNREIFEELYPEEDEKKELEEDPVELEKCNEVQLLEAQIQKLEIDSAACTETINSATRQLETLDSYNKSLTAEKSGAEDVVKTIEMYDDQRKRIFARHTNAAQKLKYLQKAIAEKVKEKIKTGKADQALYEERVRARTRETERKANQQREIQRQLNRVREERLKFYPKKVYKVTVNLDTASNIGTPALSRRGSADSFTLAPSVASIDDDKDPTAAERTFVSLSLSYVTRDASWTPRYDISVSSVQKTAAIAYRAELVNGTSETWKDAQLYLSTSQTSYGGLEDKVPTLQPWHVKLGQYGDQGLLSPQEKLRTNGVQGTSHATLPNRNELFGSSQNAFLWGTAKQQALQSQQQAHQYQLQQQKTGTFPVQPQSLFPQASISGFGNTNQSAGVFGSSNNTMRRSGPAIQNVTSNAGSLFGSNTGQAHPPPPPPPAAFRPSGTMTPSGFGQQGDSEILDVNEDEEGLSQASVPQLGFPQASWEDDGLTSTYEIPGTRTLVPSSLARRHKLASLTASNVTMNHVVVPKLLVSTFFRAKIRNPSSTVTLLKGTAGVTLDGSFLGNVTIGRVSPGRVFELPLGIDPAVFINYPKPTVRRSTQGLFNKETAQVFARNVWITNSKSTGVEISILDQIPISGDERLSVGIIEPRGLYKVGDVVRAGSAATEGANGSTAAAKGDTWGKAKAILEEDGKITWIVNLEKKQACLLKLEYETRMPSAEKIMPA